MLFHLCRKEHGLSGKIIASGSELFSPTALLRISYFSSLLQMGWQLQSHMFRSNGVGCFNGFIHVFCDQNITKVIQRFLDDLFTERTLTKPSTSSLTFAASSLLVMIGWQKQAHVFCLKEGRQLHILIGCFIGKN